MNNDIILFVFRRDFRLHDNTTFIEAVKLANLNGWKVLPAFIFNPEQIDPKKNAYFSSNCVQFMIQCLQDLDAQLKKENGELYIFHGSDSEVFGKLSKDFNIKAIASNKDITPFALKRDEVVQYWCDKKGIDFLTKEDYTMYPIEQVRTNLGKPYEIYTPFYRRAIRIPVPEPHFTPETTSGFVTTVLGYDIPKETMHSYYTKNEYLDQVGGRDVALDILEKVRSGGFRKFKKEHDFPIKDGTTKLSAYLKFGCVSVREAFKVIKDAVGKASLLVGQLYWREFYYNVAYHYPEILKGQLPGQHSTPMHGRYEKAEWNTDEEALDKWKTGQTGYPIVDAAMRCLNKTGWLHNRLRMIVAMFLVRDLDIDWRVGEKYFAQHLVDYDPPNNSQGWCWVLSYRRKFNPYKQTGKYDAQCEFVKKWVPELVDVPVLDLICWWEKFAEHPDLDYPRAMIDIQGYRVKFKTYIPDYVRPKDPTYVKPKKKSKYGLNKNPEKYNKNKERNKLRKLEQQQQAVGGRIEGGVPRDVPHEQDVMRRPPPPPPPSPNTQPWRPSAASFAPPHNPPRQSRQPGQPGQPGQPRQPPPPPPRHNASIQAVAYPMYPPPPPPPPRILSQFGQLAAHTTRMMINNPRQQQAYGNTLVSQPSAPIANIPINTGPRPKKEPRVKNTRPQLYRDHFRDPDQGKKKKKTPDTTTATGANTTPIGAPQESASNVQNAHTPNRPIVPRPRGPNEQTPFQRRAPPNAEIET